jgi:2-polyprenyl-3-methyl-5-hydroxy-6-metoxy-1,4-benzoquinol methylase
MNKNSHWEGIYENKSEEQLSWHRGHLEQSLAFIDSAGLAKSDAIIDVGGGTSTLVDDLLARGYSNLTVLDLSARALEIVQKRLGASAHNVKWIAGDVTDVALPKQHYRFWHDRAVFHFLKSDEQRKRYVDAVRASVQPGGHVLVATFGVEGPLQCSGLEVERYSEETLHAAFGADFQKVRAVKETHLTPWGKPQEFLYCHCLLRR